VNGTDNARAVSDDGRAHQEQEHRRGQSPGAQFALIAVQALNQAHSSAKLYTFDTSAPEIAKIKSGQCSGPVTSSPTCRANESGPTGCGCT